MSDSFHGRNTVLLQTHFILEKTPTTLIARVSVHFFMVASLYLFEWCIHSGALTPIDGEGWTIPLV